MRHDVKYTQSHSAPIRQRTGSMSDMNEHNYRYHHGNHYRSNGINGYSATNVDEHGGTVSALSGGESHESQKQWDWLEDVLAKSSRNKETVRIHLFSFLSKFSYFYAVYLCDLVRRFYHVNRQKPIFGTNPFIREKKFINCSVQTYAYLQNKTIKICYFFRVCAIIYANESVLCGRCRTIQWFKYTEAHTHQYDTNANAKIIML